MDPTLRDELIVNFIGRIFSRGKLHLVNTDLQEDFGKRAWLNHRPHSYELEKRSITSYVAGSSGCVVAARLAADLKTRVPLLEAVGSDESDVIPDPNRWPMTLKSEKDRGFVAGPNRSVNGRAIPYSMGKVLGSQTNLLQNPRWLVKRKRALLESNSPRNKPAGDLLVRGFAAATTTNDSCSAPTRHTATC